MTTHENNANTQKVVLITGASSGIGEATARLLARLGLYVVLGARRTERLETLESEICAEGGSAKYCDLNVNSDLAPFPITTGESILRLIAKVVSRRLRDYLKTIYIFCGIGILPVQ